MALKAVGCTLTVPSLCMAKKCLFIFILELLNGEADGKFFEVKAETTRTNRANREKKRLARKRARAAKRERSREANALSKVVGHDSTTCTKCGRKFTSRKTLSKHACVTIMVAKAKVAKEKASSVQAHLQSTASAAPPKPHTTESPPTVIAESSELTPVKGLPVELGQIVAAHADDELSTFLVHCRANNRARLQGECENCNEPRRAFKTHGGFDSWYPKCLSCAPCYEVLVVPDDVWDWIGSHL